MPNKWEVNLLEDTKGVHWPADYFPRRFHYKHEAKELKDAVERRGGRAEVRKVVTEIGRCGHVGKQAHPCHIPSGCE